MALVPTETASWLLAPELVAEAATGQDAVWGASARDSRVGSPLAERADAEAEAARQAAFLGPATTVDRLLVPGVGVEVVGTARVFVEGGRETVGFVLGADEADAGASVLTVLRRL